MAIGYPLTTTAPLIALAAPCLDLCNSSGLLPNQGPDVLPTSAGSVLLFPLSSALRGEVQWSAVVGSMGLPPYHTRALLGSALPDARYGWTLGFQAGLTRAGSAAGLQDLVVAAPQYTRYFVAAAAAAPAAAKRGAAPEPSPIPSPPGDSARQLGALLVYAGGSAGLPAGFVCAAEAAAAWRTEGLVEHGRLGSAWALVDWDGDGGAELVVGAPRAALAVDAQSSAAEYGGALHVFRLPLV